MRQGIYTRGGAILLLASSGLAASAGAQDQISSNRPATAPRGIATLKAGPNGGFNPTGGVGVICTHALGGGCQLPDQLGHGAGGTVAATSDTDAGFAVADSFSPTVSGSVNSICWWGIYVDFGTPDVDCAPGPGDVFRVTYFLDTPGVPHSVPGAVHAGPFGVVATKAPTGNFLGAVGAAEFEFTGTHAPVPVTAGECYWIQIQDSSADPQCLFLWVTAPGDDGFAAQDIGGDGVFDPTTDLNDFDQAFCIDIDTTLPTACINPGCPGAGACDIPNGSAGCDDAACCNTVCSFDAFCCDQDWDPDCALAAFGEGGVCILPACGAPLTGDCHVDEDGVGNPFCDDLCNGLECTGCCDTVCGLDPYCCDTDWDGFCVDEAIEICIDCGGAPANDNCADASPIGLGTAVVTNVCSTSDGPDHAACNDGFLVGMGQDVWFSFTSTFTGLLGIFPPAEWRTQVGVYLGVCGALEDPPLACGQDTDVFLPVTMGTTYLIRLGGSFAGGTGTGPLTLAVVSPACDAGIGDCYSVNGSAGCDDVSCCATVCAIDSACCDVTWDQSCADLAAFNCPAVSGCDLDVSSATVIEAEPCDELASTNGACNNLPDPPTFTLINAGDIIHGIAWSTAALRDTDFYLIDNADLVAADVNGNGLVNVLSTVSSELPIVSSAFVDPLSDCLDDDGLVGSASNGQNCVSLDSGSVATVSTEVLDRVAVFAAVPVFDDSFNCAGLFGHDYLLTVEVIDDCPWDCATAVGQPDGQVNIVDLLALLAAWGAPGSCDFDGGGVIDIVDLLALLANWGPC